MRNDDRRSCYVLTAEAGFVLALVLAIAAFRVNIEGHKTGPPDLPPPEIITMKHIAPITPPERVPPPPRPGVPVVVDNDAILDSEELVLDPIHYTPPANPGPPPPEPPHQNDSDEPEPFVLVEEKPALIGGLAGLQKRIVYPDFALKARIEGRVILEFVIDREGRVTDIRVLKGIGGGCNEEAVRALSEARFTPGRQRGRAVPVQMSLPITFRLK